MLLRQPGSPGPSVLFFPSTAARTAVGIPGSAEEFPEDSGSPGRDLFAGEELRTYLERRLGGLHPDDAGAETKVIDVTGPGGECLPWSGLNLSRTADLDAVRRAEPFRRACFQLCAVDQISACHSCVQREQGFRVDRSWYGNRYGIKEGDGHSR